MYTNIYNFICYKSYINESIKMAPNKGRGLKKKIAEELNCQNTYVSHVLSGKSDFSLEQGKGLAKFFSLNTQETRYLFLLINYKRAGTVELKNFLREEINDIREKNKRIKERVKINRELPLHAMEEYYSNWTYGAVHMTLLLDGVTTINDIALKLKLDVKIVRSILIFLESIKLISSKGNRYIVSQKVLHLDRESSFISIHHQNWRLKVIDKIKSKDDKDLNYSLCFTCERKDVEQIKEVFLEAIEKASNIIKPSKSEELMALNLDIFSL